MNSKFLILAAAFAFVGTVAAEEKKEHKFMCKKTEIKFDDEVKKSWKECWGELKERKEKGKKADKKGDDQKHFQPDACFAECKLGKMKAVVDGKFDIEVMNKFIDASFPKDAQKAIKDGIKKCADDVKDVKLCKDEDCKSYEKFGGCQMEAIMKACKNDHKDDA